MSYAAAIDQLFALAPELAPPAPGEPRRRFDLASMRALAAALGHPERATPTVLVAGTNGKGSTSASLAAILAAAGYRVGLYTSPHLQRVNERIQISTPLSPTEYTSADAPGSAGPAELVPIPDDDFARLYFRIDATGRHLTAGGILAAPPSFFERLTAMALLFFAERRAEIAVLEVGLGGRLDATNIVEPMIAVITDIALDHQEYLGNTLAAITREKAGILREGGTLITLPQHPEANQALGEVAATLPGLRAISAADLVPPPPARTLDDGASRLYRSSDRVQDASRPTAAVAETDAPQLLARNRYVVSVDGEPLAVDSALSGSHQQRNLALAIAAARELRQTHGYTIPNSAIADGLRRTVWPGRLQSVALPGSRHTLLLDVAHNPAGAWTLRAALAALPADLPRTLLFSCLRDKDLDALAQILFPLFDPAAGEPARRDDHIVLTPVASPRAALVADLLAAAQRLDIAAHAAPHLAAALAEAIAVTPPGGAIVVTGSVYLIGGVLEEVERSGLDRAAYPLPQKGPTALPPAPLDGGPVLSRRPAVPTDEPERTTESGGDAVTAGGATARTHG